MAARDPWSDFEDEDPWASFDDAKPSKTAKSKSAKDLPSLGLDSLVSAVDGDTARLQSGRNLRLWGVDAPELKQQGYTRDGQPVPIGQQSKAALSGLLGSASHIGQPVSNSWGRPVAPVTLGNADMGQTLARQGNVLAVPDYLKDDPDRQFQYMQAERLARRNGLGIHDTRFQPPAEFRKAPIPEPSRETVAQWWDTPTPESGLRPELEKRATELLYDPSVSLDDVAAFVKESGGILDMDSAKAAREWATKTGERMAYQYRQPPKVLTDAGDGRTGAVVRSVGSGALADGLDEAGALVDTLGLTSGRENLWNSDRRFADVWENNRQQNAAILGYDEQTYPYSTTAGEVAGGLVVPFGARAKTASELFRVGAGYGAAQGFLGTDGEIGQRAIGGAVGVPVGGAIGFGAGKALQYGLPVIRSAMGRRAAKEAGETAEQYAGNSSLDAAQEGVQRQADGIMPPPGYRMDDIAMAREPDPSVPAPMRQPDYLFPPRATRMDQPLTDAQRRAIAENVDPRDVLPIRSNEVGSVEEAAAIDAGRFAPAKPVDEMTALERRTLTAPNGREVPKRGPLDIVTWLRTEGGVKDQGGNLRAMGIGNTSRDLDFARGEQRFGKLIDDENGMSLDDAAFRAWEAGYLPGSERPDINALLDAIDRTHSGAERFFHPDDLAEVAKFEGMRADRLDLEEQLADGPVYNDRSAPADDQPFPPPEAYEDWPAGGPDFAGNINLGKLDSPQDIARALDMTQRRVGFDAATRGRVSQAETERLAADLNMTPETLMARRKGQAFNAEEALAARQILAKSGNELVNMAKRVRSMNEPGEDVLADFRKAWVRHVAIQEQVSGMTAEAGRALQQFRQMADSRAVQRDVLTAMVRGGGGRENLQDAAQTLLDAVEAGPGVFNTVVEGASKPKWRNRLSELYINALLSWPQTHAVNITSNTLTALAQVPEHMVGAAIGKVRQLVPGANVDRIIGSEIGARTFGLIQGAKEGARLFAKSLKTGEPSDFISKVEGQEYKAIPGLAGEVIRTPTRLLTAEDELFKGIARRMEINGLAARQAHTEGLRGEAASKRIAELAADPTDEMLRSADDYGRYLTFQTPLGPTAQKVSAITNENIVAKLFMPFVRTPTNLLKFAAERSPAAPLLSEWKADFKAGGARRDMAIAKAVVGTGVGAMIYEAAINGHVTGSAPTDPRKARLLYADGWKPNSIKVGETYYSYRRLDPFSTTLGVAADLATLPEGMSQRQREDGATLLVASVLGNLASKTWLSGLTGLVEALSDPERNADNMMQRLVGSLLVPNLVAGTARTLDPTQREVETIGDALQSRLPGARDSLPPRRDIWGEIIKSDDGLGPDWLSPVWTSEQLNDPVNRELLGIDYAPGYPSKKIGGSNGRELSPAEYDRYQELAGKGSHGALTELVRAPGWKAMDEGAKRKAAQKVVSAARRQARDVLFGGGSDADEWDDFEDAGGKAATLSSDPWDDFKDAPQADVMGQLQLGIPGVRFTSGFRTPAYQEQMRRRGYNPAVNSSHLDGSALDMLPPAGKSLGWLKSQVAKQQPDARLLVHDGHLHATFPGWYGAPVLGGAKAAGLRNPMAGR